MLFINIILIGFAALTQAAPAPLFTITPPTNITDSPTIYDPTNRGYPLRCNDVNIKLEDFQHAFNDIQEQMRHFVQNGERLCQVTDKQHKYLAHWGSSYVTLTIFEATEMWVECDQVLVVLQDLWVKCGNKGGSAQTYWEHVVVHHTDHWV